MGILGSLKKDIILMMLPIWLVALALPFSLDYIAMPLVAGICFQFFQIIESAHVWSSFYRAFSKTSTHPYRKITGIMILLCLATVSIIHYLGFFSFFIFITALSIFHALRQTQGIIQWWGLINKRQCEFSRYFYLVTYPLAILILAASGATHNPTFNLPVSLKDHLLTTFIALHLIRIGYELYLVKKGTWEPGRVVYLTHVTLIVPFLMIYTNNYIWGYVLVVFDHSWQYLVISLNSQSKIYRKKMIANYKKIMVFAVIFLIFLAILWGTYNLQLNYLYDYAHRMYQTGWESKYNVGDLEGNWKLSLFLGISFTPGVVHYFIDAFIWKREDPEAKIVYEIERPSDS